MAIGVGAVLPALSSGPRWLFVVIGAPFGVYGMVLVGFGSARHAAVQRGLDEGDAPPLAPWHRTMLSYAGMALGAVLVATIILYGWQW